MECRKYNTDVIPEQCWFSSISCEECLAEDKRHKEAVAKLKEEMEECNKHFEFGW